MHPQFICKDGKLNYYAFACGYVEPYANNSQELGDYTRFTLEMEHEHFHVKGFYASDHFWEVFDTLTKARKFLRHIIKAHNAGLAYLGLPD